MQKQRTLRPESFTALEAASAEEIAAMPLRDRFRAIRNYRDIILRRYPAPENSPHQRIPEDEIPGQIAALTKLTTSIRHSDAYMEWLTRTISVLKIRLAADQKLLRLLKSWPDLSTEQRKNARRRMHKMHTSVARKLAGFNIAAANIVFESQEKSSSNNSQARGGVSRGSLDTRTLRSIMINEHEDGNFSIMPMAIGINYHETVHSHGLQLGRLFGKSGGLEILRRTGMEHDGELWSLLRLINATLPMRIHSPYRNQFHEVVAYEQQAAIKAFLREEVGTQTPIAAAA